MRWRKDYLQSLQLRQKWVATQRNLHVGDIVIIKHFPQVMCRNRRAVFVEVSK